MQPGRPFLVFVAVADERAVLVTGIHYRAPLSVGASPTHDSAFDVALTFLRKAGLNPQ
jgi:hypothetical protein